MFVTIKRLKSSLVLQHNMGVSAQSRLFPPLQSQYQEDEPIPLARVFELVDFEDGLLCLSCVEGCDSVFRLFAVQLAKEVLSLARSPASQSAVDTAEAYAMGRASTLELNAAYAASYDAAWDSESARHVWALPGHPKARWAANFTCAESAAMALRSTAIALQNIPQPYQGAQISKQQEALFFRTVLAPSLA